MAEVVRLNSNYAIPSKADIEVAENMDYLWYGGQIELKKNVSNTWFLSTGFQFTRVQPQTFFIGFGGYKEIRFDYFKIRASANFAIKKWLHFGIGGNCNILDNFRYITNTGRPFKVNTDWQREYGITGIAGAHWRRFGLDFNYFHAFTQTNDEEADFNFYPIRSLSCVLYYEFDLSKKKKRRK